MITMADAVPEDVNAIVALYAELDEFYGAGTGPRTGTRAGAAGAHDAPVERLDGSVRPCSATRQAARYWPGMAPCWRASPATSSSGRRRR